MPYIYSLAGMTHFDDYTIMRPLVMDFTADARVNNIGDQFMFGPALMAAPVYKYGDRTRSMYFPAGTRWYNFYDGAVVDGGRQLTVDAPYERMPLYVRAGSILPTGKLMQYADQLAPSQLTVYVYQGADGKFSLYEDEGTNYNYEKGAYAIIPFVYNDADGTLTIGRRQGRYDGMLDSRTFRIVKVSADSPVGFDADARAVEVKYDGSEVKVKL